MPSIHAKPSLVPDATVGFEPVRYQRNGNDRRYTQVTFTGVKPKLCVDRIYRQMRVFGYIANTQDEVGGLLDLIDDNGDIIDHITVTGKGLSWLYKKFSLRVVSSLDSIKVT